jgi:hypothetical protein
VTTFLIMLAVCILIGSTIGTIWGRRMRGRRRQRWPDS